MFTPRLHFRMRAKAPRFAAVAYFAFALIFVFCGAQMASAKSEWLPIPKEDIAATESKGFPGASAEVLLSNRVLDEANGENCIDNYHRIKIYDPAAAQELGILHIPYTSKRNLWNLAARLTKPDGTTTEFDQSSFTDTVAEKTETTKVKRKSLALPNLTRGDILEMQWSQANDDQDYSYYSWFAQVNFPVRLSTFKVVQSARDFRFFWFNVTNAELKGGNLLEMRNLPAFEKEPLMPPEREVRGWYMIVFTHPYMQHFNKLENLWSRESSIRAGEFQQRTKAGSKIKSLAADLVRGSTTDEEKLQKLYDYCRQEIQNFNYADSPELKTAKEKRDKSKSEQWAENTLSAKTGYPHHINELFAALARGAGFDVRYVRCSNRDGLLQIYNMHGWLFTKDHLIAVKVGNEWKLYAPGNYFMPPGMIPHKNEMAQGLQCDEDEIIFADNPVAPAAKTPISREGHFKLDADGTLEGDVEMRFDGHAGATRKSAWNKKMVSEIEKEIRSGLIARLPSAEISDIAVENARTIVMPLTIRYKVRVPGYAEVAGTRIVLSPNYFEHGRPALFTAETRKSPIFFDYARTEHDRIDIALPEGYTLDAPSAPVNVDQNAEVAKTDYKIAYKSKSRILLYERNFTLASNGVVAFQAGGYPVLKNLFERINRSDEHSLVLKPKAKQPATPAPESVPTPTPASAP